jgi:hypothetical protein
MKIILTENQLKKIIKENNESFNDKIFYHGRTKNRPYNSNYIYLSDSMGYADGYSHGDKLYLFKIPFSEDKIFSMRNKKHRELLKNNIDDNSYKALLNSMSHNEMDWTSLNYIMNDEYEDSDELLENLGFLGVKLQERPEVESIYIFNQNNINLIKTIDTREPKYQKIISKYYKDFEEKYVNEGLLKEGTNRGEVYHYTNRILKILSDNKINLSSNLGSDKDQFGNKYFFLSLSRTPGVNIGYGRFHNSRLVLDGNKLNQNFKSIPVDYWGNKSGDNRGSDIDFEYEDRIISDKSVIDNITKYIIRIEIVAETPKTKKNYEILQLAKQNNIPIFFYLNKNDLQRQRNNVNNEVENISVPYEKENKTTWENNYKIELSKILSIVLYEDGIIENENLLKDKLNKITQLYNLPELSLWNITENMRIILYFNKNEFIYSLKNNLRDYFKNGKGDNFREWIKILINEMKKFKVTSIEDLVKLKYENNENNNN